MARRPRPSPARVVRLFRRVALQRFEEAQFLRERSPYTTAAVYLAGYAVECILKALILSNESGAKTEATLRSFRGTKAHDFEWLKHELQRRRVRFPPEVSRRLADATIWSTDLRYSPSAIEPRVAEAFLQAAEELIQWALGRL